MMSLVDQHFPTVQWGVVTSSSSSGTAFSFPISFSTKVAGILGTCKSATFSSVPVSFDDSKTTLTGTAGGFRGGTGTFYYYAYGY